MGWLGWTPDQVLAADVNAIIMALEGRKGLLKDLFGSGNKDPKQVPATPDNWAAFRRTHNARIKARHDRRGQPVPKQREGGGNG